MNRRTFELIVNEDEIKRYQKCMEDLFDCNLDSLKKFCINPEELKISHYYTSHDKILIQYQKKHNGDFSLYYSKFCESNGNAYYLFGSSADRSFGQSNYLSSNKYIKPKLITNINSQDVTKSGLVFARDCRSKEVVLLLRIDWTELSDREKDRLMFKNEKRIFNTEDDKQYISFGSINSLNIISLLKNIRGFVSNTHLIFDDSEEYINNPHIKIKTVNVPQNYKLIFKKELSLDMEVTIADIIMAKDKKSKQNLDNLLTSTYQPVINDKKIKYCMLCGREIEESYIDDVELKELLGENINKCKDCVEEIMISYFKSKVNNKLFNRYLDLLKSKDLITEDVTFDFDDKFNKEVKDYSYFYQEIPKDLKIEI